VSSPLCDAGGAQPAARAGRSPGRPRSQASVNVIFQQREPG